MGAYSPRQVFPTIIRGVGGRPPMRGGASHLRRTECEKLSWRFSALSWRPWRLSAHLFLLPRQEEKFCASQSSHGSNLHSICYIRHYNPICSDGGCVITRQTFCHWLCIHLFPPLSLSIWYLSHSLWSCWPQMPVLSIPSGREMN